MGDEKPNERVVMYQPHHGSTVSQILVGSPANVAPPNKGDELGYDLHVLVEDPSFIWLRIIAVSSGSRIS